MTDLKRVRGKLLKVKKIFNLEKLINFQIDNDYIKKYYSLNRISYKLFHSSAEFIHFGISQDGIYKASDLEAQPLFIAGYIEKLKAKKFWN